MDILSEREITLRHLPTIMSSEDSQRCFVSMANAVMLLISLITHIKRRYAAAAAAASVAASAAPNC